MDFVTDQLKLLGFNDREVRVFTTLIAFGRMKMTTIASRSGVARTSVDAIVRRLEKQGIVTREKVGGHWEYSVHASDVAVSLTNLVHKIDFSKKEKDIFDEKGVIHESLYRDRIERQFNLHVGERTSILLSVLGTGRERVVEFEHILNLARHHEIRLEILTCEHVANDFSRYAREVLALLTSYELRMNILPRAYCLGGVDFIGFRDVALALDHHSGLYEEIATPLAVEAINHLLFVARETGWSIDLGRFLESRIEVKRSS